ncbi:MAG: TlyA family RNA methyltransferase [Zetaproteobacteria bacterium]|nr:MAG: TlyA family RNA methyltransferase [Zetaproteobacteria bacterium]
MAKLRLDQLLLERGFVESRSQAQALIMAGLVYVNGQKADKAGSTFDAEADITVRETLRYVSRGGLKLEKAIKTFPFDPQGCTCLDVGASTGGFTDVLLQHGASCVYAVDVGHGQLHYRLRQDPRVINLEKTHVRNLDERLIPQRVDALVIDTSFISLSRVLPHAWTFLRAGGWCVALIKPQFEVGPKNLRKGVVRDERARQQAVKSVLELAKTLPGCRIIGVEPSPITGPKGNIEYLLGLVREY